MERHSQTDGNGAFFAGRLMTLSVSLSFIQSAVACCYKGGVVNTNEKQSSFSKHHLLSDKKGKKE